LRPHLLLYPWVVALVTAPPRCPPPLSDTIYLLPRSTVQAMFYLSHGVVVPPEHLACGLVRATVEPDGQVFDWQEGTQGLFTVRTVKQDCRPEYAHVAVQYHGCGVSL